MSQQVVPFFLSNHDANFIEKLLKPQLINKLQNICEKLLNTCSFKFIFPICMHCPNQMFMRVF